MFTTYSKATANAAVKTMKVEKTLTFTQGNLMNLEKISVDSNVGALLTKINGEIALTINGQKPTVIVKVAESDGSMTSVKLEEFARALSAPQRVYAFAKKHQAQLSQEEISEFIAHVNWALGYSNAEYPSITVETMGLIKQQIAVYNTVEKNRKTFEVICEKHPQDPLRDYLRCAILTTQHIVCEGIWALATKSQSVSEINQGKIREYKLPVWLFGKLTKDRMDKGVTPTLFLFPRKAEKGIAVTTLEIRDEKFRSVNAPVFVRSSLLVGFFQDNALFDAVMDLSNHLDDEANHLMFERQMWNLFPMNWDEVDGFLAQKAKHIVDIYGDGKPGDLKKKMVKLNNALLRTAMLESSGPRPDLEICKKLCPTSTTEFNPATGVDIYEALRKEPNIEKVLQDFLFVQTPQALKLWMDLFSIEMKVSNLTLHTVFKNAYDFFHPEEPATAEAVQIPAENQAGNSSSNEEKPQVPKPEYFKVVEDKLCVDLVEIILTGPFKPGDPRLPKVQAIKPKLFAALSADKKLDQEVKKKPPIARSVLTKEAKSLLKKLQKDFGEDITEETGNFLRSFSSVRLQKEAVNSLHAAANQSLKKFFEEDAVSEDAEENPDELNWG